MTIEQTVLLATLSSLVLGGLAFFFFYERRYAPRRARQRAERLRREEAAGVPPSPRDYHYAISLNPDGFCITDLRGRKHKAIAMSWSEVCRATAFKRDLLIVDCICLFLARLNGTGVELNEEMARWKSFVDSLPRHLTGCEPWSEWFGEVAFPAFALNETEIYVRSETQSSGQSIDAKTG